VTEGASNQEDWSVAVVEESEEAASQEDWSTVVVEETESLPVWETEVHLDDGGWDTSCYPHFVDN
jgi:hypothetical protein